MARAAIACAALLATVAFGSPAPPGAARTFTLADLDWIEGTPWRVADGRRRRPAESEEH